MEDFRHNFVNLTGFRLVMAEGQMVKDIIRQMKLYERHSGVRLLNASGIIKVSTHFEMFNIL